MTTSEAPRPAQPHPPAPTVDDLFDDGEVEQFLADLYAMRRSDVA